MGERSVFQVRPSRILPDSICYVLSRESITWLCRKSIFLKQTYVCAGHPISACVCNFVISNQATAGACQTVRKVDLERSMLVVCIPDNERPDFVCGILRETQ